MISNQENILGDLHLCKRLEHCKSWWVKHAHPKVLTWLWGNLISKFIPKFDSKSAATFQKSHLFPPQIVKHFLSTNAIWPLPFNEGEWFPTFFLPWVLDNDGMIERIDSEPKKPKKGVDRIHFVVEGQIWNQPTPARKGTKGPLLTRLKKHEQPASKVHDLTRTEWWARDVKWWKLGIFDEIARFWYWLSQRLDKNWAIFSTCLFLKLLNMHRKTI